MASDEQAREIIHRLGSIDEKLVTHGEMLARVDERTAAQEKRMDTLESRQDRVDGLERRATMIGALTGALSGFLVKLGIDW